MGSKAETATMAYFILKGKQVKKPYNNILALEEPVFAYKYQVLPRLHKEDYAEFRQVRFF